MREFCSVAAAMAGALYLMSVLVPVQAQGVITLDHAVRNCRLIGDKEARLACYDRVIDEADASLAPQAAPAPVALAAPPALLPAPVAVAPPAPPSQTPVQAVGSAAPANPVKRDAQKPKGDALKIASAKWGANGGVEITLGSGSVWRQVDSTALRLLPKTGDTLSISTGVFGKHLCQYGSEETFDCRQN